MPDCCDEADSGPLPARICVMLSSGDRGENGSNGTADTDDDNADDDDECDGSGAVCGTFDAFFTSVAVPFRGVIGGTSPADVDVGTVGGETTDRSALPLLPAPPPLPHSSKSVT